MRYSLLVTVAVLIAGDASAQPHTSGAAPNLQRDTATCLKQVSDFSKPTVTKGEQQMPLAPVPGGSTSASASTVINGVPFETIMSKTRGMIRSVARTTQSVPAPLGSPDDTPNGTRAMLWPTPYGYGGNGLISPDSLMLGGQGDLIGGAMTIRGLPYGPFDTGSLLSIVASDRPLAGTRAGIGPNGASGTGGYGNYDEVNEFNEATSPPPRFIASSAYTNTDGVAHTVTYDATHAYFRPDLSKAQVAMLRPQMHVMTNSVDGVTRLPLVINGRMPISTYGGQVQSWATDGSSLTVDGWAVPGGGFTAGAVPGKKFDTQRSSFSVPALMMGVYTKTFARNTVVSIDNTQAVGDANNPLGQQTTLVREGEGDEIDLWNYMTSDYKASLHGITIVYSGIGIVPSAGAVASHSVQPTSESYGLKLAGDIPNLLELNGSASANFIVGPSILVKGNGGVSGPAGSVGELFENSGYMDGTTNMRLVGWLQKDRSAIGASGGSMHVGLVENGIQGSVKSDGALQSQLVFNPDSEGGSIGLFGYKGSGVLVHGDGSAEVQGSLSIDNALAVKGNQTLAGSLYAGANIVSGPGSSVILRTAAKATGGTIASDAAGDVVIGTGLAGGSAISKIPVVVQNSLTVNGTTTFEGLARLAAFAVSSLPMCMAGQMVFASNGRNNGEAASAGTGLNVTCNSATHWIAPWSGVAVTQ